MIHAISREPHDPMGYGDGQDDLYVCACGDKFGAVQYGGADEAIAHLEEVIRGLVGERVAD